MRSRIVSVAIWPKGQQRKVVNVGDSNVMQSELEPVMSRTLDADAAERIRQLLISGKLSPGTHLRETELARHLGVSGGTVRAALLALRHDGLVEYRPNRGSYVASLNSADAWELYTLRNALEAMAARLAAERASEEDCEALTRTLEAMSAAAAMGDTYSALQADEQLHRLIIEAANHGRLSQMYTIIQAQTSLFMALTEPFHSRATGIVELHEPLVSAILAGNGRRAESLARDHNTVDGERLHALLEHLIEVN